MQGEMMLDYKFKTKPYDHQKEIWEKSWQEIYYALFAEMGTGKSKIAIDTIGALYLTGKIDTVLVLAPKGVFDNWVKGEVPAHLPDNIPYKIVRWQPNWTKKYTEEIKSVAIRGDSKALHILVMNIEALSTEKGAASARRFLERNPENLCLIDESTTIKNRKAQRTKTVINLTDVSKYRRILTGSPITKSPMDLYAQCAFLSPKALGFKSFYAFQGRYAVIQRRNMGHRSFQHVVGYRKLEELSGKLEEFSVRVLKSECLDLPDKVYTKRDVPLTPEQKKIYTEMKELALAQLDDGQLSTTASVLTQIMRLQQIVCGFLQPDDGPIQTIKNNRMPELMSVIEETQGKAIIWATWTHDILAISAALTEEYGEDAVASYYGATPQDERQAIVERFQDVNSPLRFFVGQPRTGGYGITLTAAQTMVYYSNSYDLEIRLQSEDRAHRIGQTKSVTYIDLISPGTIDEIVLAALRNKINIASTVLGEDVRDWLR
jgi:SNF2 family DNA or RNA helicase